MASQSQIAIASQIGKMTGFKAPITDVSAGIEAAKKANAGLSVNRATNPSYRGEPQFNGTQKTQTTRSAGPTAAQLAQQRADAAEAARVAQARNDWGKQRDTTFGSITDRIGNDSAKYESSVLDYQDSARTGIRNLNEQGVQNELSRSQGMAGVLDMVGRGVRSAGVQVANRPGASDSSAGEAIGLAYGDIGQRANAEVGNQYEQGKHEINLATLDFDDQMAQGARHLNENKQIIVNGIVSDAHSSIAALNAQAASASLPDRIDIEAKKQEIRNNAMGKLSTFDGKLKESQGMRPADVQANRGNAANLATAGNAAANPFEFTAATPGQFQTTGPFASELPLFSTKKRQT